MRILITNDDGIDAPGLQNLLQVVSGYSFVKEVWIVAPDRDKSCASHSMSLQKKVVAHKRSETSFAVDGTPVDCVILAICSLMKDCRPDLIISGINAGANLDMDIFYSGTVAAAREGRLFGIPAIAVSQFYRINADMVWQHQNEIFSDLLSKLMQSHKDGRLFNNGTLININLPACSVLGVKYLAQGHHHFGNYLQMTSENENSKSYIIGTKSAEVLSMDLQGGYITVTPLGLNLTDYDSLQYLQDILAE